MIPPDPPVGKKPARLTCPILAGTCVKKLGVSRTRSVSSGWRREPSRRRARVSCASPTHCRESGSPSPCASAAVTNVSSASQGFWNGVLFPVGRARSPPSSRARFRGRCQCDRSRRRRGGRRRRALPRDARPRRPFARDVSPLVCSTSGPKARRQALRGSGLPSSRATRYRMRWGGLRCARCLRGGRECCGHRGSRQRSGGPRVKSAFECRSAWASLFVNVGLVYDLAVTGHTSCVEEFGYIAHACMPQ